MDSNIIYTALHLMFREIKPYDLCQICFGNQLQSTLNSQLSLLKAEHHTPTHLLFCIITSKQTQMLAQISNIVFLDSSILHFEK